MAPAYAYLFYLQILLSADGIPESIPYSPHPPAMFDKADGVAPLTINTRTNPAGKPPVFTAATFHYTEEPARTTTTTSQAPTQQHFTPASSMRSRAPSVGMHGQVLPPTALYVRALYNYESDDRTSLSFRQGDTIQVITQLTSGWWDGVIKGVRGWFPSNYCVVVTGPEEATARDAPQRTHEGDLISESGTDEEYEAFDDRYEARHAPRNDGSKQSIDGADKELEEASFWIPQATPDGRLFYFNTLTGVSTMELPLETPTSANETGPRDRMNIHVPDQTRPPPEMMARGLERDEDESETGDSASELEESSVRSQPRRRRSYISDGTSPAVSTDSFDTSSMAHNRSFESTNLAMSGTQQPSRGIGTTTTSFTSNPLGQVSAAAAVSRSFFDDGSSAPQTWTRLVENIRKAIESYRQAINNADRSEYVRKAEDISDHLRMLLAAASGTTDNHSGNPSIISTNKALYPHFRDMMSHFSKLVLSSHLASADWPAQDAYTKCLQEAEEVILGVENYVEIARSQRGEEIPRLVPGFFAGSNNGGSWQNNGLGIKDPMLATSFMDQDEYEPYVEPVVTLDGALLERMDELKRIIVVNTRRLEDQLSIREKLITPFGHRQIATAVCQAAAKVIELFRPWLSAVESINLSPLGTAFQNPQLVDFTVQKQKVYDLVMQLLLACQAVAAPLGDEWAECRGDPLEERLNEVRVTVRQLENYTSQVGFSLQLLLDSMPKGSSIHRESRDARVSRTHRIPNGGAPYEASIYPTHSKILRTGPSDMNFPVSHSEGVEPAAENYRKQDNNSKLRKLLGDVPRDIEEEPSFLKLDYEGEISYDTKVNPPQLRGGTLIALVEQLTRHDRLDSHFNNTFLLTYRSFTTASELFEILVKRFSIQPPPGISQSEYNTWVEKKQKPIRFRVVNILKSWFDSYWMENSDDASNELLRKVYSFAKDSIATSNTPGSGPLMTSVERRIKGHDPTKGLVPTQNSSMPTPIMPKNMKKLKFLDIDPTEFARQLTIIESRLYGKIKPTECLNKTWQRKLGPDDPEPAGNVKALILHSNQLTNWVAEMILNQSDVKKRVVVIKHFVSVADVSPNYHVAMTASTNQRT